MKKTLIFIALIAGAQQASAACLKFVNGQGPTQIAHVPLVAQATEICVYQKNRFAGSTVNMVQLNDAQGELASFTADLTAQGRGLGILKAYTLQEGTSNGQYFNATGVEITIEAPLDPHLQIAKGKLTIKAGRSFPQTYLVISKN